jgi:hypothetical protein
MNLFRSEEHVRNWSQFDPGTEDGIISVADGMRIMSTARHRERLNGHYVSSMRDYVSPYFQRVAQVTRNSPFWAPPS